MNRKKKTTASEVVEISKQELAEILDQVEDLAQQVESLAKEVEESKNKEQRALADYQNLVRRTADERVKFSKLAARDFVEGLVQPLDHLSLAAQQINDSGLNMVVDQIWKALDENGLQKMNCLGKNFDLETMEVVERGEKGEKVVKVVKEGYVLNDEVIQHAKVILD